MHLLQRTILNLTTETLCPIEEARLERLLAFERAARERGCQHIAGVDEAGRGCLAGPVVAAACIIPENLLIVGVNDSKQLTSQQRETLFELMMAHPDIHVGIGIVDHKEIDRINIFQASVKAMLKAVKQLPLKPDHLLVDGLKLPHPKIPTEKIIKGDTLSLSIAGASIAAKVTRDRLMVNEFHKKYPEYGFDRHKGYGTQIHLEALDKHGPCAIHRRSYAPVQNACQAQFAF